MFKKKKIGMLLCIMMFINIFTINVKAEEYTYSNNAIGNVNIISTPDVSLESVEAWARSKNATDSFINLASLYKKYSSERGGINWVLAYVQAAKETGYGRFGGVLDESYHNPCGLKNPAGGDDYDQNAHKRFDNWEQGVIAHLDHLALYAAANGYPKTKYVDRWRDEPLGLDETYDPRHTGWYSTDAVFGQAKDAISLGGRWAPSATYGVELFRLYCEVTNSNYLPARSYLDMPSLGDVISDGKLTIKGWALHAFGIKEVRVLIDGKQIDKLEVNVSREDVNKAYPGYFNGSTSGFYKEISLDLSSIESGTKKLQLDIVANNGSIQTIEKNIIIASNNLPIKSCLDTPRNNESIKTNSISIRGWALNSTGVKEVRVYVDGKDLGTVPYGTIREDVNEAYPGYPSGDNAGFDGIIDISSILNGTRKISVRIIGNDGSQEVIEKTIRVEKLVSRSWLDTPNNNEVINSNEISIKGWALAASGVKEVRIYVDGKDLGAITYGTIRDDVNKAYPGYSSGDNAGFEGTVNISSISAGNKKLTVKIIANDETTQTIDRTIKIGSRVSRSWLDEPDNNTIVQGKVNVKGWALAASGVKEVRVYVDGKDLGTVNYGTMRSDVNEAYPGYLSENNSGFEGTVNISSISAGSKKLTIKITANDGSVQTIERTIKVEKLPSISCLDEPTSNLTVKSGQLKIRGWALSDSGVKEVRVYVDGKDLGTVPYGTSRSDVNKVYPGYSSGNNPGFDGIINISSIPSGNKNVSIKITSNDGTTQTINRTIKIEKLASRSYLDEPTTGTVVNSDQLNIRGWALAGSGVKEVRLYINETDLGTIPYGTSRPDVNSVYPGYPSGNNAGFDGTINLGGMATGEKTLKVKITANDGTNQIIERSFTYRKAKLVVVDPGHEIESVDPGAVATHSGIRYVEGNLNLQIAIKLKAELEARGIQVYMTRYDSVIIDRDSTESLKKRVKVANEMNADLFVSIHHNSFNSSSANGFEVYYSTGTPITTYISERMITEDGRDLTLETKAYASRSTTDKVAVSKALATAITNEASSTLGLYNRGAKDSNLYVCKNTIMPSILIENGFLTNPTEAAKVSTGSHQQKLAEITAKRINEVLK